MRVKTQEGVWTDLSWWNQLAARETSVVLTADDLTMVIADLETTAESDGLFREMNRRIRMHVPSLDVPAYLVAADALANLSAEDPTTQGATP